MEEDLTPFGQKLKEFAAEKNLTLEQVIARMVELGCPEDEARFWIYGEDLGSA